MKRAQRVTLKLIVLSILHLSCGSEQETGGPVLRPVRFEQVFATGGDRIRSFSGVSQAGQESRLSFKVAGTVRRILVKVGDTVQAGDQIAELDATDYQLQVQQAEASLESAKAQERNARSSKARVERLWENRNASRNDLDAARAAQESASAQVKALENQLDLSKLRLSYTRLLAPTDGAIATLDVEVNENVRAGQTIVELSSGSQLEVQVTIPELLISQVREGQAAEVKFDALPNRVFLARITEVGISPTSFATAYPVTVLLDKRDPDCRPGMAAEVLINFDRNSGPERIVVPSFSVGNDRLGQFVYVVQPGDSAGQGVVSRRAVVKGQLTDNGIEILEGLVDGELVVTAGVTKLSDGQRVKFDEVEDRP